MSGLVAIFHRDGSPVDRDLLGKMTAAIAHRGPDETSSHADGSVGLAFCAFHTTPEAVLEKQPLRSSDGNAVLIFDGRIDNRLELRRKLESHGLSPRTDSDAELVLLSYQHWADECPAHFVGEFALVLWDQRRQRIFCARDIVGARPLYYALTAQRIVIGSELRQLLLVPDLDDSINESMVAEYLAVAIVDREATLYRGISRLPPAHTLVVGASTCRTKRYWDLELANRLHYRRDSEYVEHFAAVLGDAVASCLRCQTAVGAYLSGGLDSSAIACLARHAKGFETFSLVFPDHPESDESRYIRAVVDKYGWRSNELPYEPIDASAYTRRARACRDFCDYPNDLLLSPLRQQARMRGFRVLLTGYGGDEWLTGSVPTYADRLRNRRLSAAWQAFRNDAQGRGPYRALRTFTRLGLMPLLPRELHRATARWQWRRALPWLRKDFARANSLYDKLARSQEHPTLQGDRLEMYTTLNAGWWVHGTEVEERACASAGIEQRSPFLDRRLIEFCFSLPDRLRLDGVRTKSILREAMDGVLPDVIRRRDDKVGFDHTFTSALTRLRAGERFHSLPDPVLRWVDPDVVTRLYEEHLTASKPRSMFPLWAVAELARWLDD